MVSILLLEGETMFSARLLRSALFLALLCLWARSASALQLGETRAQLISRHGAPAAEDHARNLAMYFWEGWSAQVEFQDGVVRKLTYRRNWYLQEAEINSLLQQNGGAAHWKEVTAPDSGNRRWERDDGAAALCAREKPVSIVFLATGLTASALLEPTVVFPAVPSPNPTFAKTPSFPRLLTAVPEPDLPVADPPSSPVPTRPLPKLPAAEIPAESSMPISTEPTAVAPLSPTPPEKKREPSRSVAAATSIVPPAATSHQLAYAVGGLLALAALGGCGVYWWKRRSPASPAPSIAPKGLDALQDSPEPVSGVEGMRLDQFELLIGEIYRRQGYSVELSGAVNTEDGIDLVLRRDGETIPVQCKHWKMRHVGERELREFYGTMATSGAPRGFFVTTGDFSLGARTFAGGKEIELVTGNDLTRQITAAAKPGENLCHVPDWIDEFVAHARIFDPECPICHGTMVVRHHRASGAPSWTCRGYPRCPGRREPRLDLLPNAAAS